MRIPSNIIIESKYTAGKEFMYLKSYKEYQGYYYELNNKFFTGKTFSSSNSKELVKIESKNINTLLTQASTYVYGLLSKTKILNNTVISTPQKNSMGYDKGGELFLKFYCKKNNINPILIKQINEQTYLNLQKDPIYQTIFIGTYQNITVESDKAYQQMVGLREFVEG
jgi:hypothetical protein